MFLSRCFFELQQKKTFWAIFFRGCTPHLPPPSRPTALTLPVLRRKNYGSKFRIPNHKFHKLLDSRWLTSQPNSERIIEQWNENIQYFLRTFHLCRNEFLQGLCTKPDDRLEWKKRSEDDVISYFLNLPL